MKIIGFGQVNSKLFFPILGGIIRLILRFLLDLNPKYEIAKNNLFIMSIYTSIGMILSFIPYLILKYRSKKLNDNLNKLQIQSKSKLNINFEHFNIFKETRCSRYKLNTLSAICDFTYSFLVEVFCGGCIYNLWIFDILFLNCFSYIILNTKLYKHHYISMIAIIIFGFLLNIIEYFKLGDKEDKIVPFEIFAKFASKLVGSFNMVIVKYNMEKNFSNSYEICLWNGAITLILFVICLIIVNKYELTIKGIQYPDNIRELIDNFDYNDLFVCLLVIFINCIYNIFLLLTCNFFTPSHTLLISMIYEFYFYLQFKNNFILNILGLLFLFLIIFMLLIFIEIIEIKICNMSKNTTKNIQFRAKTESLSDIDNDNSDEDNDDDI